MSFLSPILIPLAMGLTVPPLVLLYFLKLKRREQLIASTLLWRQAVQDLQVNAPFQKLRNNLLLILQLLALLAGALAMAEPFRATRRGVEKAVVLMIDHAASMAADEGSGRTRLEIAGREALQVIDEMTTDQRALVIAFGDRARVLTSFTDDKDALRQAIRRVRQTDEPGRLREAMELAEAHSTPLGEDIGTKMEIGMSHYMLFTDGRLPDAAGLAVQRGTLEIVRIGEATNNVGIVDLEVRRHYEQPERVSVLARVRNFGSEPVRRDVSLYVDGQLKSVTTIDRLAPMGPADRLGTMRTTDVPPEGSDTVAAFEFVLETGARIEVQLSDRDALATDDRAYAIVTPPRPMTALLVTPGNRYLRQVLDAMPVEHYDIWSPEQYEKAGEDKLIEDGRSRYDVVILDGHSTERLPAGNYLFFASVPLIEGVATKGTVQRDVFLDWDDTHPILRHVKLDALVVFSWLKLELPRQAVTLIDGSTGPVMALLTRERNQYLLCAFGLFDETRTHPNTNWIFQDGLVIFMYNALRFLSGSSTIGQQPSVTAGQSFTVSTRPGTRSVKVVRPDGETEEVAARESGLVTYGRTDRVGIYSIDTHVPGEGGRAVNLLDEEESFIAPNTDFRIAAGQVRQTQGTERASRALWPYLLGILGVILLVEWIVYNKRVFI